MKKTSWYKIIYYLRNILLFPFLYSCIRLVPNIHKQEIIGIIVLIFIIIYILFLFFCFIKKDDKLNYCVINNVLNIILYVYVFILAINYARIGVVVTNDLYFKINYLIIIFGIMGIITTGLLILGSNEKKQG